MKFYVAAPYPCIEQARALADLLMTAGFTSTATWLDGHDTVSPATAQRDLDDVVAAEVLVVLNPREYELCGTGGRHVELGYALALDMPVVLVGRQSNLFHSLPRVCQVEGTAGAIQALRTLRDRVVLRGSKRRATADHAAYRV